MNAVPEMHLVLHALAIKKNANATAVAGIARLEPPRVERVLEDAVSRGSAVRTKDGFALAPLARMTLDGEYSRYYGTLRGDPEMRAAYERFEVVNAELKSLMTDWQTLDVGGQRLPNDHSDADHDARVLDRLGALHERAEAVLARFEARVPRLAAYREKLLTALERAEDGGHEWVSGARIESYHTVWFELHEDLLRMLGRTREE